MSCSRLSWFCRTICIWPRRFSNASGAEHPHSPPLTPPCKGGGQVLELAAPCKGGGQVLELAAPCKGGGQELELASELNFKSHHTHTPPHSPHRARGGPWNEV